MDAQGPEREFRGGLIVGRDRNEPIEVVPWDPAWPRRFEELRARLAAALGEDALRIDHVGSTAIDGLPAKPIIDIQVSVADINDDHGYRAAIESGGFELRAIEPGHRYFRPPPGLPRDAHVHVCAFGGDWERRHLLFRDYLRSQPALSVEYAAIKERLARQHRTDRLAYTHEKGPFIEATLTAAEGWVAETGWQP